MSSPVFYVCTAERKPEINRQSGSMHVCLIITFHIYYIYSYVTFVVSCLECDLE